MKRKEVIEILSALWKKDILPVDGQDALVIAIKALEQTRWIPVSEQLPEDDGYYLVTFQRNLLTRTEQYTSISEFREGSWTEFGHIVAWCELPTPYKEVEDDRTREN